jgi:GNAT superfamily N-acetyltransferase
MGTVRVRQANPEEINWINERYDEVSFIHSDLARDFVAIAELDAVRAGLGRVVRIDPATAELGGMYVLTEFRGQGIADAIVRFLLNQSRIYSTIYCIPFAHLSEFYQRFGFVPCQEPSTAPEEVRSKHAWCNGYYPHPTMLLVLKT